MTILVAAILALYAQGVALPPIRIEPAPYVGELGLTCRVEFREVPGNVQEWCGDFEGIILYPGALRDEQTAKNIITHELFHWTHGANGPTNDPFNEHEAYRSGCNAYPIPECVWMEETY